MTTAMGGQRDLLTMQPRNDLSSLASHAAVELDEVILGRAKALPAVQELAGVLSQLLASGDPGHPTAGADPRTLVTVARAINDSGFARTSTVYELRQEAEGISRMLLSLTGAAEAQPTPEALAKMREFCLKLSKLALASRRTGPEFRQHPLRR